MTEQNKSKLKEFLIYAATIVCAMIIVSTGAGSINYGCTTGEHYYAFCGSAFFVMILAAVVITMRHFLRKDK